MSNKQNFNDMNEVIAAYFEGLYQADSKMLSQVFHPDAKCICIVEDQYTNYDMKEYFKIIDERISPASTATKRVDKVISIEFGGSRMAFIKVSLEMFDREYLDFLTLANDEYGWRLMSKVFHYEPKEL
ncbi:MAG: nuclear transport factor 2 family protein [Rhizobiales bacterium]|nr:nuclear transport factor 2 family protein [Hyphomicrobiales bacterium]